MLQQPEPPCCPRCGGVINVPLDIAYHAAVRELVGSDYSITFTPSEGRIFELLWKNRSRHFVSAQMMHDALYADDPNGGAFDKIIPVFINAIRKKLCEHRANIDITTEYLAGYQLKMNTPARRPRANSSARHERAQVSA